MTIRRRWRRLRRSVRSQLGNVGYAVTKDGRRLTMVLVGIVIVLALAITTWEAFRAVAAIREAEQTADHLTDDIVAGDVQAARRALERLDASTSRAADSTDGPVWWLGAHVPLLGRNVEAVRTAAREIDQVTDEALPGIVDVADKVRLETFRPKNGRIDLGAVAEATPAIALADRVLAAANRDIEAIDVDGLIGPLRPPMSQLQERFQSTASAAGAANEAARLIPSMAASDGRKRVYLLLIMNNAEIRSLSGMPGSVAEITAKAGRLKMEEQGGIQEIPPLKKPRVGLSDGEKRVFQSSVATDIRDTAAVPHFPRAAELAAAVVGTRWKEKYDGVVAVDPVAMGYMLGGLGPVGIGDGETLTSSNAVSTLLNGVYVRYPTNASKQDEVFETAAKRIFDAMVDGQGDSVAVVRALVRGVAERRIMLWSRDAVEQERIESGFLSGSLETGTGRPQVGVFVNDGASTKMEYYLTMSTKIRSEQCLSNDAQELKVTTTLVNNAPDDAFRLPASVTGLGDFMARGHMLLHAMILGPRGGDITAITVDGQRAPTGGAKYLGRPVANVARQLPPGRSSVIVTTMRTPAFSPGDPELRNTPGIGPGDDDEGPSACGD